MTWGSDDQVWFLQRRFHKDILLNPVLVLSFCPDLSSKPGNLGTATRELLFLLDGSSIAHKACGAGCGCAVGWGQPLTDRYTHERARTHTHTHIPLLLVRICVSPRFQKPLSHMKLPNPKTKGSHTPPGSLTHSVSLTLQVSLIVNLRHAGPLPHHHF